MKKILSGILIRIAITKGILGLSPILPRPRGAS
jgi:hypothetical protein